MKKLISESNILIIFVILLAGILRLPFLDKFPPALYSDEVSQGYNAYSILKTGKDEYGKFLPMAFRSFGDWKPPLQTYLMVPSIALFGLNSYGVRFSSAILGTLTILIVYLLFVELLSIFFNKYKKTYFNKKLINKISLLTAFFIAISPWHISESRSSMLVGVTLFFYCLSLWLFFIGFKKPKFWIFSSISFVFTIYGYYGMRVIVPLTLLFLLIFFTKEIIIQKKILVMSIFVALLGLFPLFVGFITEPNLIFGRAKTVSIFFDQGITLTVWDLIKKDGINFPTKMAQFFHNKPYYYFINIIQRYFEHIDGRFLFLTGDQNPPFQLPNMGVMYLIDGLFLFFGLIFFIKNNLFLFKFVLVLIFISIFPAALTFMTPASNRSFHLVIPLLFLVSGGILYFLKYFKYKFKKIFVSIIVFIYIISFGYFIFQYVFILPKEHSDWWYYGYSDLVTYLESKEDQYDYIYISGHASVPYIYILFYKQIDPALLSNVERDFKEDVFGFEHVTSYGKYIFPRYFKWEVDKDTILDNSLLVVKDDEKIGDDARLITEIKYPNNKISFKIYEIRR